MWQLVALFLTFSSVSRNRCKTGFKCFRVNSYYWWVHTTALPLPSTECCLLIVLLASSADDLQQMT